MTIYGHFFKIKIKIKIIIYDVISAEQKSTFSPIMG